MGSTGEWVVGLHAQCNKVAWRAGLGFRKDKQDWSCTQTPGSRLQSPLPHDQVGLAITGQCWAKDIPLAPEFLKIQIGY